MPISILCCEVMMEPMHQNLPCIAMFMPFDGTFRQHMHTTWRAWPCARHIILDSLTGINKYDSFFEDTKLIEREIETNELQHLLERLKKIGCQCVGGCDMEAYTNRFSIKVSVTGPM